MSYILLTKANPIMLLSRVMNVERNFILVLLIFFVFFLCYRPSLLVDVLMPWTLYQALALDLSRLHNDLFLTLT